MSTGKRLLHQAILSMRSLCSGTLKNMPKAMAGAGRVGLG